MRLLISFGGPDPAVAGAEQFAAVWLDSSGKLQMTASPDVPPRILEVFRTEYAVQLRTVHQRRSPREHPP